MKLRPEVQAFAEVMEQKLRENDYKGGWEHCSHQYLSRLIREEERELSEAIKRLILFSKRGEPKIAQREVVELAREAADVANIAMFICSIAGALPQAPQASPAARAHPTHSEMSNF